MLGGDANGIYCVFADIGDIGDGGLSFISSCTLLSMVVR